MRYIQRCKQRQWNIYKDVKQRQWDIYKYVNKGNEIYTQAKQRVEGIFTLPYIYCFKNLRNMTK